MRYSDSIFGHLLKPIVRRRFDGVVDSHDGNAYDKEFDSWDHLVVLIYAQLSGVGGLRGLEAVWNANSHHHYHLGVGAMKRSTLSDANQRRPLAVFTETFSVLSGLADRMMKREGQEMLRLIDSSPVPLGQLVKWAKWNGRIRGLKLHVVYDPVSDNPVDIAITHANVNDVAMGEQVCIEAGHTYVFDKAYCKYQWWTGIHDAEAMFVTRQKASARFRAVRWLPLRKRKGDGFTVIEDAEVRLVSKGDSKLAIPMRRIRVRRDTGAKITLLTNDFKRTAVEIAALYKKRWQIELLFRWIKQHLKIRSFLGRSDNAIRLQVAAAMIAYVLLRIAARESGITMPIIRFADLLRERLFTRRTIDQIDKPPPVNPSKPRPRFSLDQMELAYA
jgi:putative transposase